MLIRYLLVFLMLGVLAVWGEKLHADDETSAEKGNQTDIAAVLIASVDIVFSKHVDPPTRGELLRRGIKGMFTQTGVLRPDAVAIGRRITELEPAEYAAFLREMIGIAKRTGANEEQLQVAFLSSLLEEPRVRNELGVPRYVPEKEYRVQQQIRENRYVGIGIALGQTDNRPVMMKVFPNGPAGKGGARDGDIIVTIDGTDTAGMPLGEAVDLLRGSKDEPLTLTVRQPDETTEKTLDLVRGEVPFETVVGSSGETGAWRYDIEPTKKIAYVKIVSIRGSTVGELRETARRLRRGNYAALILDLRQTQDGDLRHTIILADELLGQAPLGAYTDTHGTHEVTSNAESLLPELPLAVLVDATMSDGARWIAAALQDNKRGVLVGRTTPAEDWYACELTKLPMGAGALLLPTAILHRPNPIPARDHHLTQWAPGSDNKMHSAKREIDRTVLALQPGFFHQSLLPDHLVHSPPIPGGPRPVNSYTSPDRAVDVAIEVLQEQLKSVGANETAD